MPLVRRVEGLDCAPMNAVRSARAEAARTANEQGAGQQQADATQVRLGPFPGRRSPRPNDMIAPTRRSFLRTQHEPRRLSGLLVLLTSASPTTTAGTQARSASSLVLSHRAFPAHRRAAVAAADGPRVRRGRNPSARARVGRGAAVSGRAHPEAGRPGPDGDPVSRAVRRRGDVRHRLLPLHGGARARRSVRRAVGRGAQRPGARAHLHVRLRRAEVALADAARPRREAGRVGADRAQRRQ